jgi:hypothetical protein
MIPLTGRKTLRGCFADRHRYAGMDQPLPFVRKGGDVIEKDQCVNTAFLMQGGMG